MNQDQTKLLDIASELMCPECASKNLNRSRRRGILEPIFLYLLGFHAFQCETCYTRFYYRTTLPIASSEE